MSTSTPTPMPEWLQKQFDAAQTTCLSWSPGKRQAAGIPPELPPLTDEEYSVVLKLESIPVTHFRLEPLPSLDDFRVCERCSGSGRWRDPADRCPVEGWKMVDYQDCIACGATGTLDSVVALAHRMTAEQKRWEAYFAFSRKFIEFQKAVEELRFDQFEILRKQNLLVSNVYAKAKHVVVISLSRG